MYYGIEMSALNFEVKKVTVKSQRNNICWNYHCTGRGIQHSASIHCNDSDGWPAKSPDPTISEFQDN